MSFTSDYYLARQVAGSFGAVVTATRTALATEGFGVLTEIDLKATLAAKLNVTTRPYVILGACNPTLAHRAIEAEPGIGTLLPCNVVVAENADGTMTVAAVDPRAMFAIVHNPALTPIVDDIRARLERVIKAVPDGRDV